MNVAQLSRSLAALAMLATACTHGAALETRPRVSTEFSFPTAPAFEPLPRQVVARGLLIPRGMEAVAPHELLVAEAGTGAPDNATGGLTRLTDVNHDGDFDDDDERTTLLGGQPSRNVLQIVRRDEVFGMGGMATGQGRLLVSLAFFGGPSTIFEVEVERERVSEWGSTHGNINDLTYDAAHDAWFGAASTTDEIVRLLPGGGAERVLKLPLLPNGQDAVPGYLKASPYSKELLVTLFSGSPEGEEGGQGVELVPRAGGIIAVDPDSQRLRWLVRGLSVPTDLEVGPDGALYVLELCDGLVDPIRTRAELFAKPGHGGFRRFSGRLLRIDLRTQRASVLAQELDTPTNLLLVDGALYVAQGMGTPGREIPGPNGIQQLDGFIERFELAGGR